MINTKVIPWRRSASESVFASLLMFAIIYIIVGLLCTSGVYDMNWILSSMAILSVIYLVITPIGYFGLYLDNKIMTILFIISASILTFLIAFYLILFYSILQDYKYQFKDNSALHLTILFFYTTLTIVAIAIASIKLLEPKHSQ